MIFLQRYIMKDGAIIKDPFVGILSSICFPIYEIL